MNLFYNLFAGGPQARTRGIYLAACLVLIVLLHPSESAWAEVHVPVGSPVYQELDRLESEGLITTGLLESMPLTRHEVARLIKEAEASGRFSGSSESVKGSMGRLKRELSRELSYEGKSFLKPVEKVYLKYLYSDGTPFTLNKNNRGDRIEVGSNVRTGFSAMGSIDSNASFYLNPEFRYSPNEGGAGDNDLQLAEGYAALQALNLEVTAGRESLWWGPGYNGALLLSNNAKPFDLIKFTNPQPATLPWLFKYLGPFRFTFFVTRLEDERDYSRPYLSGLRFDFRPLPLLTIGLSRVALFGGGEREFKISDVILSRQTNEGGASDPGDQIASGDFKLIIPWSVQPFTVYAEIGGEDGAGGMPSHIAYIVGIYLPHLYNLDSLSFRVEYSRNFIPKHPNIWYNHYIYTHGYTYKGEVIGHFMNSDARNYYFESSYDSGSYGTFAVSLEDLKKRVFNSPGYIKSISVSWGKKMDTYTIRAGYILDHFKNSDWSGMEKGTVHTVFSELEFLF